MAEIPLGLVGKEPDADWYDRDNRKNVGMFDDSWKNDILIGLVRGVKVLEVGCNEGKLLRELQKYGYYCWGCDISKFIIDLAKEKSNDISYAVGTAYNIPFKERFHTIIVSDLIEHLENIPRALEHWKKHLEKRGRIVILTPNAFAASKLKAVSEGKEIREPRAHINMQSVWTLTKHIKDAGLELKHISNPIDEFIIAVCE